MKKLIIVGFITLVLSGCYGSTINYAHEAVKGLLKDPTSAQFNKDTVIKYKMNARDYIVVCGLVNAKNGFGGYAGNDIYYTIAIEQGGHPVIATIVDMNNATEEVVALPGVATCLDKMNAVYH